MMIREGKNGKEKGTSLFSLHVRREAVGLLDRRTALLHRPASVSQGVVDKSAGRCPSGARQQSRLPAVRLGVNK
jgi:hypothetical protein